MIAHAQAPPVLRRPVPTPIETSRRWSGNHVLGCWRQAQRRDRPQEAYPAIGVCVMVGCRPAALVNMNLALPGGFQADDNWHSIVETAIWRDHWIVGC